MLPPDPDSVDLTAYLKAFENMTWDEFLGLIGTYFFIGAVVIPGAEVWISAADNIVEAIIFSAPYISAIIGLIIAFGLYLLFPSAIRLIEAVIGICGVFYQIAKLQSDVNINAILGLLGAGFMTIHAVKAIKDANANKPLAHGPGDSGSLV